MSATTLLELILGGTVLFFCIAGFFIEVIDG